MKRKTVNFICRAGNLFPLQVLLNAAKKTNICLFYHSVNDEIPIHLKHLYRPRTSKEFSEDLDYLAQHFKFITTREILNGSLAKNKPSIHLSFDDGLKACYDHIYPLLIKKGIPATFFINPSFVDNKNMFHNHKASLLKETFLNERIELQNEQGESVPEDFFLKNITSINRFAESYYNNLAIQLGVNFEGYLKREQPYLSLEQLKKMNADGFEIGGHTLTHPLLSSLPEEEQVAEILGSMQWLKDNNISDSGYFAFPFNDIGIVKNLFLKMEALGITQSFGTSDMKEDMFGTHHHRISFEDSDKLAEKLLKQQLFKNLLLQIIGKNRIVRH